MEIELETISPESFKKILKHDLETFEANPNFRLNCTSLAGSEANARTFLEPRGVGIGEFSRIVGMPVSTVRHYIRMGLVEPFVVNTKFKFQYWNPAQAESVRWWSELGFTLEEIVQRKLEARARHPGLKLRDVVRVHVGDYEGTGVALFTQNRVVGSRTGWERQSSFWINEEGPQEPLPEFPSGNMDEEANREMHAITAELLEEYRAARDKLEAKRLELDARIARTLEIERKFSGASAA